MSKKIIIAWIVAALFVIGGITSFILLRSIDVSDPAAEIHLDGKLYKTVTLSQNAEFTVNSEYGCNTIRISDGEIAVIDADCPDKVCIASGAISDGIVPIICLPHRLEIRIISAANEYIDTQIR
jgi:hypothetical protein